MKVTGVYLRFLLEIPGFLILDWDTWILDSRLWKDNLKVDGGHSGGWQANILWSLPHESLISGSALIVSSEYITKHQTNIYASFGTHHGQFVENEFATKKSQSNFYPRFYHWRKGKWPDAVNCVHIEFHSSNQERESRRGGENKRWQIESLVTCVPRPLQVETAFTITREPTVEAKVTIVHSATSLLA